MASDNGPSAQHNYALWILKCVASLESDISGFPRCLVVQKKGGLLLFALRHRRWNRLEDARKAEKEGSSPGAGTRRLSDLPPPLVPVKLQLTAVDKANFRALDPSVV